MTETITQQDAELLQALESPIPLPLPVEQPPITEQEFGKKLRKQTIAVRLRKNKFGLTKKLNAEQISRAAGEFEADSRFLKATKKLLNNRDKAYLAVTGQLNLATATWKAMTVPFPEPGVRLIKKDRVEQFTQAIAAIQAQLAQEAAALQEQYAALRVQAQERLGELFNPHDYPEDISGQFQIDYEFPSVEPPDYLKQLHPDLWEAQAKRVEARFQEAVALAEQAFLAEFQKLVSHLVERLTPSNEGEKKKFFINSTVENLTEFFGRFADLNVGNNAELETLIEQAKQVVSGVTPGQLRKDVLLQQQIATNLGEVASKLDLLMVNKPERAFDLDDEDSDSPDAA
jgi:hypothetical protein